MPTINQLERKGGGQIVLPQLFLQILKKPDTTSPWKFTTFDKVEFIKTLFWKCNNSKKKTNLIKKWLIYKFSRLKCYWRIFLLKKSHEEGSRIKNARLLFTIFYWKISGPYPLTGVWGILWRGWGAELVLEKKTPKKNSKTLLKKVHLWRLIQKIKPRKKVYFSQNYLQKVNFYQNNRFYTK